MSFKHAKAVIVKAINGQVEIKDHGLIHLLNRYHCDINTKDFVIAWNQHCLNKYGYVLEIIDVDYEWSHEWEFVIINLGFGATKNVNSPLVGLFPFKAWAP